ncbi:MAG: hypothetical protein NZ988_05790 [Thaumarchaeota archaeon]|nr:hypothetical protein [Candidatus Calditenuaceae archaeon]MDW8187534.1 hypothetical protein [Nitrososphaerota archaeon]
MSSKTISLILLSTIITSLIAVVNVPVRAQESEAPIELPIRAPLGINVIIAGFSIRDFGFTVGQFQRLLSEAVRSEAIGYAGFFMDDPYVVATFDVSLSVIEADSRLNSEISSLYGQVTYDPAQLPIDVRNGYNRYLSFVRDSYGTSIAIRMNDRLTDISSLTLGLVSLTYRFLPRIANGYNIYLICGLPFTGNRFPVYFTAGHTIERGNEIGIVGMNLYGGMGTYRYVVLDVCAIPNPLGNFAPKTDEDVVKYIPPALYPNPRDQIDAIAMYIDEIIDNLFVKSLLYVPRYQVTFLFDVIVIDMTTTGGGLSFIANNFIPEVFEASMRWLMPYNVYTTRFHYKTIAEAPLMRQAILTYRGYQIIDVERAFDLAERSGLIPPSPEGVTGVPVLIFLTDGDIYPDSPGTLGIAWRDSRDPRYPRGAVVGLSYRSVEREGLTLVTIHEAAHTLGLAHPHNDLDETEQEIVGPGKFKPKITNRWVYSWAETAMAYADLPQVINQRHLYAGVYPLRSYFSAFDLDAIDRAVVTLLLGYYLLYREEVIAKLRESNLRLSEIPQAEQLLREADEAAVMAVLEFMRHNYFDRLNFAGLGAQLETAFDFAWKAFTDIVELYDKVEGARFAIQSVRPRISQLENEINSLRLTLDGLRAQLSTANSRLEQLQRSLDAETQEKTRAQRQLESTQEELSRTKNELETTKNALSAARAEANTYVLLTAAGLAAAVGASAFAVMSRARSRPRVVQ